MRLPTPDNIKDQELKIYLTQLVQSLERALSKRPETPFHKDRIKVYDVTKQYTLSCASVGVTDVGRVMGTFLIQLQESGVIP